MRGSRASLSLPRGRDRAAAPFRSGARHDREDALGAAQDRIQAELPDASDPVLPGVRRCAGRSGARASARSRSPSRAAAACWPSATAWRRPRRRAPRHCSRSPRDRARSCCRTGSARADRMYGSSPQAACSMCACRRRRDRRAGPAVSGDGQQRAWPIRCASAGARAIACIRLLVEPVLPWIPAGSHVVIAADGALHGINFETLPVPGAKRHYWIEDVEIETAPALSMLSVAPSAARARAVAAALRRSRAARSRVPGAEIRGRRNRERIEVLPGRRRHAYQGDRASPAAYKSGDARSLHVRPLHRARRRQPRRARSTRRSSSPAPTTAYKLYARDVAEMPLHAELVTVSACRSAGERAYSGEGLIGFAWAFLRAGASRVIAGLWDVDDRSTADLMDALYAHIAAGETRGARACARPSCRCSPRAATTASRTTGDRSRCSPSCREAKHTAKLRIENLEFVRQFQIRNS